MDLIDSHRGYMDVLRAADGERAAEVAPFTVRNSGHDRSIPSL
jgi:hypothetical protein